MRSARESPESAQIVEALKEGLVLINARWNAAGLFAAPLRSCLCSLNFGPGVYLQLLEAHEAMDQT